jgi:DNA polymerase-3 subunit epsilon
VTQTAVDLDNLVIFDLETTGLESDCRIVQIAMVRGDKIFQSLVNPEIPIPADSTAIHKITDDMVVSAPKFEELAEDVLAFIEGSVLSGFNIRKFDIPVLRRELQRVGDYKLPPLPILDLFELNQKMNPRSLAWFYHNYTGKVMDSEDAHDAVYDCKCTRDGFLGMFEKHHDLPTDLAELTNLAEPERLTVCNASWFVWQPNQAEPCFARGKYRGWAISDVDRREPSYLTWLTGIDADSESKNLVRLYRTKRSAYIDWLKEEHPNRIEPLYLEFRQAMDQKQADRFEELKQLALKTKNTDLLFLAAAWATLLRHEEAVDLAKHYLSTNDGNVNVEKRTNFLKKKHGLH